MTFSKPATQRELDFIRANWQSMKIEDMADELGRTQRFIYKKINDMHLRGDGESHDSQRPKPKPAKSAKTSAKQTPKVIKAPKRKRGDLYDLADVLWGCIIDANAQQLPKLSAEYRCVLEDINKQKGEVSGKNGGSQAADIIKLVRSS